MRMFIVRLLVSLLMILPLTGCASVSLVNSWKDQLAPKKSYRDFLVVGITSKWQTRQIFEEVLAAELRKKGISATASYTLTGTEEKLSRSLIEKVVQASGFDAVITARLVDLKKKSHTDVGYTMTSRGYDSYVDFYGTGAVSYATFDLSPVEVTTSKTYAMETNLFDTTTQKLVWAGTTDAVDPKGIITVSKEYAGVVITSLRTEGLIP
jgi:uncharacterized protein YceK/N-methylhydantoinase B/oxoprolinase/acetone carboxylase alpha subunit